MDVIYIEWLRFFIAIINLAVEIKVQTTVILLRNLLFLWHF